MLNNNKNEEPGDQKQPHILRDEVWQFLGVMITLAVGFVTIILTLFPPSPDDHVAHAIWLAVTIVFFGLAILLMYIILVAVRSKGGLNQGQKWGSGSVVLMLFVVAFFILRPIVPTNPPGGAIANGPDKSSTTIAEATPIATMTPTPTVTPTATATPIPVLAPTPTIAPTLPPTPTTIPNPYSSQFTKLMLDDPLVDNNEGAGWEVISGTVGTCQFYNSMDYRADATNGAYKPCHATNLPLQNFTVEVQMTIMSGTCGGLSLYDAPRQNKAYTFVVCTSGRYVFNRLDGGGAWKNLLNKTTNQIITGIAQSNTIAVVANQGNFTFYVNGRRIDQARDATYAQGLLGLAADSNSKVAFSHVRLWD